MSTDPCPPAAIAALAAALDTYRLTTPPDEQNPAEAAESAMAELIASGWVIRPDLTDEENLMPARPTSFPALAVACPTCRSQPGQLCTSHGGTRVRRNDVHQARTATHRAQAPA